MNWYKEYALYENGVKVFTGRLTDICDITGRTESAINTAVWKKTLVAKKWRVERTGRIIETKKPKPKPVEKVETDLDKIMFRLKTCRDDKTNITNDPTNLLPELYANGLDCIVHETKEWADAKVGKVCQTFYIVEVKRRLNEAV